MEESFEIVPVFRRSLRVLLRRAPTLFALGLLVQVPILVYSASASVDLQDPGDDIRLLGLVLSMLMLGAVSFATIAEERGLPASFFRSLHVAMSNLFPLLGIGLILGLFPLILSHYPSLLAAMILPWVLLTTALYAAIPALVAEQGSARTSLWRSAQLTRGRRWRIFVILVLLGLAKIAGSAGLAQVFGEDEAPLTILSHLVLDLVIEVYAAVVAGVTFVDLVASQRGE